MNVSELEGAELDAAVAIAEDVDYRIESYPSNGSSVCYAVFGMSPKVRPYRPSSDWRIGGEIIQRERISIHPDIFGNDGWNAVMPEPKAGHGCSSGAERSDTADCSDARLCCGRRKRSGLTRRRSGQIIMNLRPEGRSR